MTDRTEHRALITGASSGIGRATAIAFAKSGIKLALVSRSEDKLANLVEEIHALGGQAQSYMLDLAQVDRVAPAIADITATMGPIDILVNNAGMGYTGNLSDTPLSDWQAVINLNLTSPFQCIQGILPSMRAKQYGTIVNVVSVGGRQVFAQWGAYCTSKFGLMGLTKTLALEERSNGIRVIAVCPGAVNTPIWDTETVQADFDRAAMLTPENVAQTILQTVLLPQQAVIEELVLMPNCGTF